MLVFPPIATPHVSAASHKRLGALLCREYTPVSTQEIEPDRKSDGRQASCIESIFKKNSWALQSSAVRNMKINTQWYNYIAYSPRLEAHKSKNQAKMTK